MKNATKHADELRSLYQAARSRSTSPSRREPQEPLKALVRGAMSYDVPDDRADEAMQGDRAASSSTSTSCASPPTWRSRSCSACATREIEQRVAMITQALNDIFEREHTLSLDRLKDVSKRDARQFLRELPDIHPFVEAYVMLFGFDGHAVPGRRRDARVPARRRRSSRRRRRLEEAQQFVEHHLKAEECYDVLRRAPRGASTEGKAEEEGEGVRNCELQIADLRFESCTSAICNSALAITHDRPTPRIHPPPRPAQRQPAERDGRPVRQGRLPRHASPTAASSRAFDDPKISAVLFRAQEISRYVVDGIVDCGLTGYDWIVENGNEKDVVEICELEYSPGERQPGAVGAGGAGREPGPAAGGFERRDHRDGAGEHDAALLRAARA